MRVTENGTDEQLLVEAAQQDPSRFAELYESTLDRVYAYVARRVAVREEAEDITAEVFYQALANIGKFQYRGVPFIAWLFGIAARVLASRWRSAGEPMLAADVLEETGVEDAIEQRTFLAQLVDELPLDQRHVVIRRFVDQYSTNEIARELGRSEGAVKQLQFRALQALRGRVRGVHE